MARPEKPIDWKKVEDLLLSGCTAKEIAPHFDMHVDSFYRRFNDQYDEDFTSYAATRRSQGHSLLKHAQIKKALAGNVTMLTFLGRVEMGQKEPETNTTNASPNDTLLDTLKAQQEKIKELEAKLNAS